MAEQTIPAREMHLILHPVQAPEGYWFLGYLDSLGRSGLSDKAWGSAEDALAGADAFFAWIQEQFGLQAPESEAAHDN